MALAIFHNVADNLNSVQVQGNGVSASIGSSRSTGVDLDAQIQPVRNRTLGGKACYADARYSAGIFGPSTLAGNTVEGQPKWHFIASASYLANLWPVWKVLPFIGGEWGDEPYSDPTNAIRFPSCFTMTAAITITYDDHL